MACGRRIVGAGSVAELGAGATTAGASYVSARSPAELCEVQIDITTDGAAVDFDIRAEGRLIGSVGAGADGRCAVTMALAIPGCQSILVALVARATVAGDHRCTLVVTPYEDC